MKKAQLARREERNAKRQRDAEENREHQRRAHAKGMRARKAKREWVYEEVSDSLTSLHLSLKPRECHPVGGQR